MQKQMYDYSDVCQLSFDVHMKLVSSETDFLGFIFV